MAKKGHIFAREDLESMHILLMNFIIGFLHPFFVSVTEINHNVKSQALEISVRTFTDDLENTLRNKNPSLKVDLMNPPDNGSMDSLIKNYMNDKLILQLNGKKIQLQYVGFERVEESIWSYFEVTGVSQLKQLKVHNTILFEYKKEQINMMHVISNGTRQSRKLDNPEADWTFSF